MSRRKRNNVKIIKYNNEGNPQETEEDQIEENQIKEDQISKKNKELFSMLANFMQKHSDKEKKLQELEQLQEQNQDKTGILYLNYKPDYLKWFKKNKRKETINRIDFQFKLFEKFINEDTAFKAKSLLMDDITTKLLLKFGIWNLEQGYHMTTTSSNIGYIERFLEAGARVGYQNFYLKLNEDFSSVCRRIFKTEFDR